MPIPRRFRSGRFGLFAILGLIVLVVVIVRIRHLSIPLERDEGEFAYMGQLLLKGIPPYEVAANMKLPGTYAAYALIMGVFGQTAAGIKIGFMIVNLATIFLVFLLGRKLLGDSGGTIAAGAYAVLSLSPYFLGTSAHATHFVLLPALGGALLVLDADRARWWKDLLAGGLFGLATLMKQPGFLFLAFGAGYAAANPGLPFGRRLGRVCLLGLGASAPVALTFAWLAAAGVFDRFWFWVFTYAGKYATLVPLNEATTFLSKTFPPLFGASPPLWVLAGAGLLVSLGRMFRKKPDLFLTLFAGASVLSVCPAWYFRPHYFVLLLPALSLLAASAIVRTSEFLAARKSSAALVGFPFAVALIALLHPLAAESDFLFRMAPLEAGRFLYGREPFPESPAIAAFIRERTGPDDRVAIIGSEPQILFLADRLSATTFIYMYGLMEKHPYAETMQRDMIREVEAADPKILVFVAEDSSWALNPDSPRLIFDWFDRYADGFKVAGFVEIPLIGFAPAVFTRGEEAEARARTNAPGSHILILERPPGAGGPTIGGRP